MPIKPSFGKENIPIENRHPRGTANKGDNQTEPKLEFASASAFMLIKESG
jgi:hypothetical protein